MRKEHMLELHHIDQRGKAHCSILHSPSQVERALQRLASRGQEGLLYDFGGYALGLLPVGGVWASPGGSMVKLYDKTLFEEISDVMLLRINGRPVWCGDPEIEQGKPFHVSASYQEQSGGAWMHLAPALPQGGTP